jgi:acetoin utilization protein AcuB
LARIFRGAMLAECRRNNIRREASMSKAIPTVQKYMTTSPHSIGVEQTLAKAHTMMRDHGIRHLPVLHGGALKGMLTERDLRLVESLAGVDPTQVKVEDAMSSVVYSVGPDTPLDEVVSTMGEHKYGSAVVMQNEKVVGIFTTVDVCKALAELLNTRLK